MLAPACANRRLTDPPAVEGGSGLVLLSSKFIFPLEEASDPALAAKSGPAREAQGGPGPCSDGPPVSVCLGWGGWVCSMLTESTVGVNCVLLKGPPKGAVTARAARTVSVKATNTVFQPVGTGHFNYNYFAIEGDRETAPFDPPFLERRWTLTPVPRPIYCIPPKGPGPIPYLCRVCLGHHV